LSFETPSIIMPHSPIMSGDTNPLTAMLQTLSQSTQSAYGLLNAVANRIEMEPPCSCVAWKTDAGIPTYALLALPMVQTTGKSIPGRPQDSVLMNRSHSDRGQGIRPFNSRILIIILFLKFCFQFFPIANLIIINVLILY